MVHGTSNHELFENLRLELRRGSLVLACLAALRQERYGYTLRKTLEEQGMAIDEGTLYPLLRRLESQGLLLSEWREEDRKSTRLNSSHTVISYAVFCLKKKKKKKKR